MDERVVMELKGNIAELKINRPGAYNALSKEIVDLIDDKLELLNYLITTGREIRALIITGDNNFAAGADIADMVELTPEDARSFLFTETFRKLENLKIPTIAAVCGYALGGGLELALACDLRIGADDAQVGLPEINLGIMPGAGGTVRLPRLIGEARAKELIFLGNRLTAMEAQQYGIFNKVVNKGDLMAEAYKLAEKLAQKAPVALSAAKEAVGYGSEVSKTEAFKKESQIWMKLFDTQDQKEGMKAFLEKRKPQYVGK